MAQWQIGKEIKKSKKFVRFIRVWKIQALHGKQLRTTVGRKIIKNSGIYNTYHGPLSQEWIDGRYWSPHWYVRLTKVMKQWAIHNLT